MRLAANAALTALILALLAVAATVAVPPFFGLQPVNIVAGSMTGSFMPFGTLVYVDPKVTPTVGDVITVKFGRNTPISHRVVAIRPDPSGWDVEYVTRGDANKTDDVQPAPRSAVVGTVTHYIPYAGLVTGLLDKTPVQVFLGSLALGLYWLSTRRPQQAPAQPVNALRLKGKGQ